MATESTYKDSYFYLGGGISKKGSALTEAEKSKLGLVAKETPKPIKRVRKEVSKE